MIDTILKVTGPSTIPVNVQTSDDSAIDIPEDGVIEAVQSLIEITVPEVANTTADNQNCYLLSAELSFLSTHQFNQNDARGSITEIHIGYHITAATDAAISSAKITECQFLVFPGGIPIHAGERLHAHCSSSAGAITGRYVFYLYLHTKGGGRRCSKRR